MINNRLEKLRSRFAENEIDAVFITQPDNRRYLSGFVGSAGYLMITTKKAVLATDFRYTEQALAEAPDFEILRISNNITDWFPGLVKDLNIKRFGFESADVTFSLHQQLDDSLNKKKVNAEMMPVESLVESLRAVKTPEEIELITRAVQICDTAYESVASRIKAGMTEKQIAWELEKSLRENGSQILPFEIIVASGPHAALPHAKPSDRVINQGEPVLIDMGARYEGYASDLSRTLCIGTPDDTFCKVYHTVLDAQMAAMSIISGGITGHRADSAARKVIEKRGCPEAFGHALGHGIGLAPHEAPRLGPKSRDTLADGMVFTVEPGIYLSGWGGVRIEDTVVMENGKVRAITAARKAVYD